MIDLKCLLICSLLTVFFFAFISVFIEISDYRFKINNIEEQDKYCKLMGHEYKMCKQDFYKYLYLNVLRRKLYMKKHTEYGVI